MTKANKIYPVSLCMSALLAVLVVSSLCLFSFSTHAKSSTPKLTTAQQKFIKLAVPRIQAVNVQVMKQRKQLLRLHKEFLDDENLSTQNTVWLTKLAKSYDLDNPNFNKAQTWNELLKRVDVLPTSLVLAQAANESGWGTSRFAKQGNNYFGQWCYKPGCGIVPRQRKKGQTFEVRRFATPDQSIQSYMHILNSHKAYRDLRNVRAVMRTQGRPLSGIAMAGGLQHYSQRRHAYVKTIQKMIEHYHLNQYPAVPSGTA